MKNGNNRPKLELEINIPKNIKLLQNEPATGESQYGKWYLYNVESGGEEYSFFAPEQVQKYIEENKLGKNSLITVTKILTKDGKKNVASYDIFMPNKQTTESVRKESGDFELMRQSLSEAIQLQKELGSVIDVNRVGISLYISKSKNGSGYQY